MAINLNNSIKMANNVKIKPIKAQIVNNIQIILTQIAFEANSLPLKPKGTCTQAYNFYKTPS